MSQPQPSRSTRVRREPGIYWVQLRGKQASEGVEPGRFITEPWAGVTPWRIDGRWYAERDVIVMSDRIVPPQEPPSG